MKTKTRSNSHAPKFRTKLEMENVLTRVQELTARGLGQIAIAKEVGVSQPMVVQYQRKLYNRYVDRQKESREELVAQSLIRIEYVQELCLRAYELSVKPSKAVKKEMSVPKPPVDPKTGKPIVIKGRKGEPVLKVYKVIQETKGRLPASEYLNLWRQLEMDKNKLLGIVTEVTVNVGTQTVDWDSMGGPPPEDQTGDVIDTKLVETKGE